ncbi:MarR family winged helix-turn-helix transcriptional regulator [Raoultibacter phocaeensis]|uniref:MarR family winged helix-turn-helix transcriptional regulator n=1 Tax=Raoultibacter phocaeensis TaxID=2479841 RepID=UPI002103D389|nr:MarR family transcriptional regulator [Raoultibacter phocaeensis]
MMVGKHNQFIGYKVYDAQRLTHRTLEVALKQYDLTPGQWNLLNQLDRAGALSQRALAERTRKEQATITRYLDTLERKGFIVRTRDANDRRAHVITLTDQARDLLKHVEPVAEEAAEQLVDGIEQADIDTFLSVLDRLKQNAETFIEEKTSSRSA